MTETVFIAAFEHETNTFVPTPTTREDFEDRIEFEGEEISEEMSGTETSIGGIVDAADAHGFDLVESVAASATPGGPVTRVAYDHYTERILNDLRNWVDEIDGVALSLHGAMVSAGGDDGEGPLLAAVREAVGEETPVVATLDLHGNVTERMVEAADALVAYETFPHLDKADTGTRAVRILADAMAGNVTPTAAMARPPTIAHVPKQHTGDGPMADVMAAAREWEAYEGVLKVSVLPGFYHADVSEMGITTPVVTDDDPALAREVATDVAARIWDAREAFVEDYPGPEAAAERARRLAAEREAGAGPVVVGDFGPNPGAGGSSDGTPLLRAFLRGGEGTVGYALVYDPESVERCVEASVGERIDLTLGGKVDDRHGEPIEGVDAYVKAVTDGVYLNTGTSHSGRGVRNHLGRAVHVRCGQDDRVNIVLSSVRHSAFDAEVWRHAGVQPERLDVLCVPSFIAFLGDYGRIGSEVVLADTPGLSAVDPARFEYERIPRPLYPLDGMADDDYDPET
jgi:microcystin degradation protein MlrC